MNSSQQTCSTTLDELFQIKYCFQLHFFEEKPFRKYEYPHNWKYKKKRKKKKKKLCYMSHEKTSDYHNSSIQSFHRLIY